MAGFVDATGFLAVGGFFLSFMSGNSTRLAVGIARHGPDAAMAGGVIASFLTGVVAGMLIAGAAARHRPDARTRLLLLFVAALLGAGAGLGEGAMPIPAALVATMAMGAMNAVFARDGDVRIGLTYMTGTIVKTGQHIAAALSGGPRLAWLPWALLWASLAVGAVLGALLWPYLGLRALWVASIAVILASILAPRLD